MSKPWQFTLFLFACSLAVALSGSAQAQPKDPPAQAADAKPAEFALEPIEALPAAYPPQALAQKMQGKVGAKFLVSPSGDVEYVDVPKDQPLLDVAAQDAIVKWRFKPVLKDGKAVAVISSANFVFVLGPDGQPKDVAHTIGSASIFPARVQLSKDAAKSTLVHRVPVSYPQSAMAMKLQGTVVLEARIDKDGNVADVKPVSGPNLLTKPAMDAVKQWRYKPYLLMGQPVEVETQVELDFSLKN
jgi:TonB family protein